MAEAVRVLVRYDFPDKDGETRRERNARFGQESPAVEVPPVAQYLWEWFWDIRRSQPAGFNGPNPVTNAELMAWVQRTGQVVRPEEAVILMDMDGALLTAAGGAD